MYQTKKSESWIRSLIRGGALLFTLASFSCGPSTDAAEDAAAAEDTTAAGDTIVVGDTAAAGDAAASGDTAAVGDAAAAGDTTAGDDAGGDVAVFWEVDWNTFADTQAVIDANTNDFSLGTVSLETGVLFDGSTGKFMRATLRGDGTEDSTNYDLNIVGAADGVTDEVWIEFYIRFDDAWTIVSDDKTFFISPEMGGRWEIHYGLFGERVYGGQGGAPGEFFIVSDGNEQLDLENVWDGQWHRHRLFVRNSSAPGAEDGAFYWWFDDQALVSDTVPALYGRGVGEGFDTGSTSTSFFSSIRLGANADPTGSGVRDWGRIRVYVDDPGW